MLLNEQARQVSFIWAGFNLCFACAYSRTSTSAGNLTLPVKSLDHCHCLGPITNNSEVAERCISLPDYQKCIKLAYTCADGA